MAQTKLAVVKKAAAKKAAPKKQAAPSKAKATARPTQAAPKKAAPKKAAPKKAAPKKAAPKKAAPKKAAPKKKKAKAKLVKILLHNQGEDPETPFAEDLGPAAGHKTRRVRLANVPFLHAKPTYGDVVIVAPDPDGFLSWDRAGVDFEQIGTRIEEDGGRYAMIVDYLPRTRKQADVNTVFRLLRVGAEHADIVPEGCFGPDKDRPGRLYLAVPEELQPAEVMKRLAATEAKCVLTLVHPEP